MTEAEIRALIEAAERIEALQRECDDWKRRAERAEAVVEQPLFDSQIKRIRKAVGGLLAVDGADFNQMHLDMAWMLKQLEALGRAQQAGKEERDE